MTQYIKHIAFALFGLIFCHAVCAQTLTSSYFLESMPMRHKLNPALVGRSGYVAIPFLGNIDISAKSSMGMDNFIYPDGGNKLKTFMHPSVSVDQFMSGIQKHNSVITDIDYALISTGFFAKSGFYTIDLSVRSTTNAHIPGEFFRFLKTGMDKYTDSRYHIKDLSAGTSNYLEVAVGNARPVSDRVTIGVKVKALIGLAEVSAHISDMDIFMSENMWQIRAQGSLASHMKGLRYEYDEDGNISGLEDLDSPGVGGWGLGLDLGVTYNVLDNLTFSAAVTDLGFISWGHGIGGKLDGQPFIFEGFEDIVFNDDGSENSLEQQFENLQSDIEELFKFRDDKNAGNRTRSLKSTVRVGLEYGVLNNKISFGVLSTTRFGNNKIFTEGMISSNFRPCSWFNAALTGSVSNYYTSWGWLLNFCPNAGLNLFVGMDYMLSKVTPQYIPVGKTSANVNFGLSVPIRARWSKVQNFKWENINTRR